MANRFRNLTRAQEQAFERIAINQEPRASRKTLIALLMAELIEAHEEFVGVDRFGVYTVTRYAVPTQIHMEWCAWCSEVARR